MRPRRLPASRLHNRRLASEWLESRLLLEVHASPEFRANTTTDDIQNNPSVAVDADGDYVVTWETNASDDTDDVYAQLYTAAGERRGKEFRVNTTTKNNQANPSVAMDAEGNFVVAWYTWTESDGPLEGIFSQRFNADGTKSGSELRVNTSTSTEMFNQKIAMNAAGVSVIVWENNGADGSGYGIYGQRLNASGDKQGNEFRANTSTNSDQRFPSVGIDAAGNFVVAWANEANEDVYAQQFSASGSKVGDEFRVNTTRANLQSRPSVAMDEDGDFVIVWTSDGQDGSKTGIYAQRYNAAGTKQGSEFLVNTNTASAQFSPTVSMDNQGNFVVAWASELQGGSPYDVYLQRYDASGGKLDVEVRANTTTPNIQWTPSVDLDADGDFVLVWTDSSNRSADIVGRVYDVNTVTLSVDSNSVAENDVVLVTAALSEALPHPVTVRLSFSGTAVQDNDFTSAGEITIPANALSGQTAITARPDFSVEANETITIAITSVVDGRELREQQVSTTITDQSSLLPFPLVVTTLDDELGPFAEVGDLSLREAIALANLVSGPQEITIAPELNGAIGLTLGELKITDSVTIQGSEAALVTVHGDNKYRILNVDDGSDSTLLEVSVQKLTMTGGLTTEQGGSIRNRENLTLRDTVITNSQATESGGAISHALGSLVLERTSIQGNKTISGLNGGGAIRSDSGSLTIRNSTISGNVAGGSGQGGGISSQFSSVQVLDSTLANNQAEGNGNGGAIYILQGDLVLQRSTISGNRAEGGRGAIHLADGSLSLQESTVANNTSLLGGGLFLDTNRAEQKAQIHQSTISGNTALLIGGGLYNHDGQTVITHSTITDNDAPVGKGGGIFSNDGFASAVLTSLRSSIVAGNRKTDIDFLAGGTNSFESLGYNLIGASSLGADSALPVFTNQDQVEVLDPQLEPLQDNGGPTLTHLPKSTSPAVDRGDPAAQAGVDPTPLEDQRGTTFGRIQGRRIDIGAVEIPRTEVDADFNDDGLYDLTDLDPLAAAIALGAHPNEYDLTKDGLVDLADRDAWLTTAGAKNLASQQAYPLGDSNLDGVFDSRDLIAIFQLGEYEDSTSANSVWSDGDWTCDGDFTTADLVAAFQEGSYQ